MPSFFVNSRAGQVLSGTARDVETGPSAQSADGLLPRNVRILPQPGSFISADIRLRALLAATPDPVLIVGRDGVVTEISPAGLALFEAESIDELTVAPFSNFVRAEYRVAFGSCLEALWRGEKSRVEFESAGRHGGRRWIELSASPLRGPGGSALAFLAVLRDHTARRDLEQQLIQAQKMEVVGHLAGGVAHDFNNMLAIIMGYTEMIMDGMDPGSQRHERASHVFHTSERAAALTRQLLLHSRKETPQPRVLDLSEVAVNIDPMLRRLIGENINLVTIPEPALGRVEADPGQIEQVLMNLSVNARDAMPDGGAITIETRNATVVENDPLHPGVAPGDYAVLTVTDTGSGISDELKSKIFEPFFTTKTADHGTGLGLATCSSIVHHWHGYLTVQSKLGAGSTFGVYLPRLASAAIAETATGDDAPPPRGVETLLLVEDETGLLALTAIVLQRQGYTVLKAATGMEALAIVHELGGGAIDLVMTDMVMPEMGGRMMADWLKAGNPDIKILFTSGYTECGRAGEIDPDIDFIPKPYTPTNLLRKVREVIDRPAPNFSTQPG